MINLFPNETEELKDAEQAMVPVVVNGLKHKLGSSAAVTNKDIVRGMKFVGFDCNAARVRKIIHHIRVNQLVQNLVASSRGYYVETDRTKLAKYMESLDQRISSIQEVRNSFDN